MFVTGVNSYVKHVVFYSPIGLGGVFSTILTTNHSGSLAREFY